MPLLIYKDWNEKEMNRKKLKKKTKEERNNRRHK